MGVGHSRILALLPAQLPDYYQVLYDQNYQRLPSPCTRVFWVPSLPCRWDCEPTNISCSLGYFYQIFVTVMRKVIQTELRQQKNETNTKLHNILYTSVNFLHFQNSRLTDNIIKGDRGT